MATGDPVTRLSSRLFPPAAQPPRPFREGSFRRNPLRSERVATLLGIALWVGFAICLVTGFISWFLQHPDWWFPWPANVAGLYRVTQGAHLLVGMALIPVLLAKLWTVYPKLFQWPPFKSTPHLIERLLLAPLIAAAIFVVVTGVINVQYWYPWRFFFPTAHFWAAVIVAGGLVVHIASQWPVISRNVGRRYREGLAALEPGADGRLLDAGAIERRRFLSGIGLASAAVVVLIAGETVSPLRSISVLAPRRVDVGPQGFPVNKTARSAGVESSAVERAWRLVVTGSVQRELSLSRDELLAVEQGEQILPLACVEGWSVSKRWSGVPIRTLLEMAGAGDSFDRVRFESLQASGRYKAAEHLRPFVMAPNALVALRVEGEDLDIDHGFPARVMIPNQPGVRQTKWLTRIEVI